MFPDLIYESGNCQALCFTCHYLKHRCWIDKRELKKESINQVYFGGIKMVGKAPVFSVRVGAIQFSVWENETEKGIMRSVTFNKSYKNAKDEWKTTNSFKPQDLPLIEVGIRKCMDFLYIKGDEVKEAF